MRIKAIVLDVDGTLISLSKGVGECYAELLAEFGHSVDGQRLNDITRALWRDFEPEYLNTANEYRTNAVREREVWEAFVRRVLTAADSPCASDPEIVTRIYEAFATERFRVVESGVRSFLDAARKKGVKLFAATNNDSRSKAVLSKLNLAPLFNGIFVAGDLMWKKPSPRYFAALSEETGFLVNSMIHIGNDPQLDLRIPIDCGWRAILYDPKGRHKEPRFGHFDELLDVLGI